MNNDKHLTLIKVCNMLDVSYASLWRIRCHDESFPRPIKTINKRELLFSEAEIKE